MFWRRFWRFWRFFFGGLVRPPLIPLLARGGVFARVVVGGFVGFCGFFFGGLVAPPLSPGGGGGGSFFPPPPPPPPFSRPPNRLSRESGWGLITHRPGM